MNPVPTGPRGLVEGWEGIALVGWAVDAAGREAALSLEAEVERAIDADVEASPGAEVAVAGVVVPADARATVFVPVPFRVLRRHRQDVFDALGLADDVLPGFLVAPDPAAWSCADATGTLRLRVRADGQLLDGVFILDDARLAHWLDTFASETVATAVPDEEARLLALGHAIQRAETLQRAADGSGERSARLSRWCAAELARRAFPADPAAAQAHVDAAMAVNAFCEDCSELRWRGWADAGGSAEVLTIDIAGRSLPVDARRLPRLDVSQALGTERQSLGFEVEVPATAWSVVADAASAAHAVLRVNGRAVPGSAMTLDAAGLRGLAAAVSALPPEADASRLPAQRLADRTARLARLLPHVRAAFAAGLLPAEVLDAATAAHDASLAAFRARGVRVGDERQLRAMLEASDDFMLRGWAADLALGGEIFTFFVNGQPQPLPVTRTHRADVRDALESDRLFLGFEVWLPPQAWRGPGTRQGPGPTDTGPAGFVVALEVNGHLVMPPRRYGLHELDTALRRAAGTLEHWQRSPGAGAFFSRAAWLHLLAHVDAAGGVERLSPSAREAVAAGLARLQVADRIDGPAPSLAALVPAPGDRTGSEPLARRCAALLKRLNAGIVDEGLAPDQALEQVLADPSVAGPVRVRLLMDVAPLACREGFFWRVRQEIDLDMALHVAEGADNQGLSLLLPFAASAGRGPLLSATMRAIAARPGRGWVNTECIAHAVGLALRSVRIAPDGPAPIAPKDVQDTLAAFAEFIERLAGDPWSRLTDAQLVETAAAALAPDVLWPAAVRARLRQAFFAAYALQPAWWTATGAAVDGADDDSFVRAVRRDAGVALAAAARRRDGGRLAAEEIGEVLGALRRLGGHGVADARAWIREFALALAGNDGDDGGTGPGAGGGEASAACASPAALLLAARTLSEVDAADPCRIAPAILAFASSRGAGTDEASRVACELSALLAAAREQLAVFPVPPGAEDLRTLRRAMAVLRGADAGARTRALPALAGLLAATLESSAGAAGTDLVLEALDWAATDDEPAQEAARALANALGDVVRQAVAAARGGAPWRLPPGLAVLRRPLAPGSQAEARRLALCTLLDEAAGRPEAGRSQDDAPGPPLRRWAILQQPAHPGGAWRIDTTTADALCRSPRDASQHATQVLGVRPGPGLSPLLQALEAAWRLPGVAAACVVRAPARPCADALARVEPFGAHYAGWPSRRHARWPAPHVDIAPTERAMQVASAETGFVLSRAAGQALGEAHERAVRENDPALRRLPPDVLVAELLARAGIVLSPVLRLAEFPEAVEPAEPAGAGGSRLWSTWAPPRSQCLEGANELASRSSRAQRRRVAGAPWIVVAVLRNERPLLPAFLEHYRALGARGFVLVDNGSDDGGAAWLAAQPDVVLYETATEYRLSHYGVAWQQAVLAAHASDRWALLADVDEFLVYPGCESRPLDEVLAAFDAGGATAAEVLMVDMYPAGPLADHPIDGGSGPFAAAPCHDAPALRRWALGSGYYSNGWTWLSALRHRLIPEAPPNAFTSQKVALLRYAPWVRLSEGLHYATGVEIAPTVLHFAHFKYHAGFVDKVEEEVERMQHYDDAAEYRQYLGMRECARRGFVADGVSATYRASTDWLPERAAPRRGGRG